MEVRKQPCCMCPARSEEFKKDVCDGTQTFLDKPVPKCNFVVRFKDSRGWEYFVRGGIGKTYKAFYRKPGSAKEKGYTQLPWKDSFREAQIDLNALGLAKGWAVE